METYRRSITRRNYGEKSFIVFCPGASTLKLFTVVNNSVLLCTSVCVTNVRFALVQYLGVRLEPTRVEPLRTLNYNY